MFFFPALVAIAQIYTGRPNDILPAITQLDASEFEPGGEFQEILYNGKKISGEHEPGNVEDVGLDFLVTAARLGDAVSMVFLVKTLLISYHK